jgi:WhiB family transcriptional regulator, redox-sensing transcriptional regulator
MAYRIERTVSMSWHDSGHWQAENATRCELITRSGERSDWTVHAKCRGMNPNVFHPGRGESEIKAKAVCAACPVQLHCLRYALNASEHIGIWGSTSERQRRVLRSASRSRSNSEGITYAEAIDLEIRLWSKREALKREAKQRERQESIAEAQRLATEQPEQPFTHVVRPFQPKTGQNPQNASRNAPESIGDCVQPQAHGRGMRMKRTPNRKWRVRTIGAHAKTKGNQ